MRPPETRRRPAWAAGLLARLSDLATARAAARCRHPGEADVPRRAKSCASPSARHSTAHAKGRSRNGAVEVGPQIVPALQHAPDVLERFGIRPQDLLDRG